MAPIQKIKIDYAGRTDIGMVRTENQDSFGKFPEDTLNSYSDKGILFVVADGMGGHTGGKQASSIAVETINHTFFRSGLFNIGDALKEAIIQANSKIYETASKTAELARMGTTCTTMVIQDNTGTIGHVGDSRIYKIENGNIEQLTEDHTQVQAMLKEGVLTPEEAKVYPSKSVLARALGVEEKVKVDIITNLEIKPGQTYVLCSDGLAKVTDSEIAQIVTNNSIDDACNKLISLANERGGKDNVTVQVIKIISDNSTSMPLSDTKSVPKQSENLVKPKKNKSVLLLLAGLILLLLLAYNFRDDISSIFASGENNFEDNSQSAIPEDNQPIDSNDKDIQEDLLTRADRLYNNGRYETALDLYKEVLDEEPMNLAAIQGINMIALNFQKSADKLMADNNFEDAIKIYYRVLELQPENEKIATLIKICENQINHEISELPVEIEAVPIQSTGKNKIRIVSDFDAGEWNFLNLPSNQYNLEKDELEFSASSLEKKAIFKHELQNAEIAIDIKYNLPDTRSMVGIIVGYNRYGSQNKEDYYLLNCQRSGFVLQKVSGNKVEQLVKINSPVNDDKSGIWKIKVLCSENKIHVFKDSKFLGNWEGSDNITGNVGIITGPDVHAKFSNLHIRGTQTGI